MPAPERPIEPFARVTFPAPEIPGVSRHFECVSHSWAEKLIHNVAFSEDVSMKLIVGRTIHFSDIRPFPGWAIYNSSSWASAMALIEFAFLEQAAKLRLDCQVADGWRKHQKTYCFSEKVRIPWSFDYTLKARPSVFPYPVSLSPLASIFPCFKGNSEGGRTGINYVLRNGKLQLDVNLLIAPEMLNPELSWHETYTKKPCLTWEELLEIPSIGSYRLALLIVFDPPPGRPAPVVRDWFRRFYPGGLPSLGKHR